jgi:hypothetical protein
MGWISCSHPALLQTSLATLLRTRKHSLYGDIPVLQERLVYLRESVRESSLTNSVYFITASRIVRISKSIMLATFRIARKRICSDLPPPQSTPKRLVNIATLTSDVLRLDGTMVLPSQWRVARSKAWTVFDRSNTGIVGSNPTRGMDVCVRLFCVCVALYVGSGLVTGLIPHPRSPPDCVQIKKLKKKAAKLHKVCRAIER